MPAAAPPLDDIFRALAHPVRLAVVQRLSRGPAAVSELAEPHEMAMPSFLQHLDMLNASGLVESAKQGRVRTYRLRPQALRKAEGWLAGERKIWERRLDQLDKHLLSLHAEERTR